MFPALHSRFDAPIAALDCGERCAPYNERGVPFCCDTRHTIPSAYQAEWEYLQVSSDLWHAYQPPDANDTDRLAELTPAGQVLIECQGQTRCQLPRLSFLPLPHPGGGVHRPVVLLGV
jgi:hypothetical protein